jgi:hypothetical protein
MLADSPIDEYDSAHVQLKRKLGELEARLNSVASLEARHRQAIAELGPGLPSSTSPMTSASDPGRRSSTFPLVTPAVDTEHDTSEVAVDTLATTAFDGQPEDPKRNIGHFGKSEEICRCEKSTNYLVQVQLQTTPCSVLLLTSLHGSYISTLLQDTIPERPPHEATINLIHLFLICQWDSRARRRQIQHPGLRIWMLFPITKT